jgi:uncharacterized Fe-S cluster-containing MiaB family protein
VCGCFCCGYHAAGAAKLFPKLKSILQKIEDVVEKLKELLRQRLRI